jgi:hypothetical protein
MGRVRHLVHCSFAGRFLIAHFRNHRRSILARPLVDRSLRLHACASQCFEGRRISRLNPPHTEIKAVTRDLTEFAVDALARTSHRSVGFGIARSRRSKDRKIRNPARSAPVQKRRSIVRVDCFGPHPRPLDQLAPCNFLTANVRLELVVGGWGRRGPELSASCLSDEAAESEGDLIDTRLPRRDSDHEIVDIVVAGL